MGEEATNWLDRVKKRPAVATVLAVALAIGAILSFSKDIIENTSYLIGLVVPTPKPPDTRLADAFSLGLLTGNLLFEKTSAKLQKQKRLEDPMTPPPIEGREKQLYRADIGSAQQLLKDMSVGFDPEAFELDPTFFPTVCEMSAVVELQQAVSSKYGENSGTAFKDGCMLRTMWFASHWGRVKVTGSDDSEQASKEIKDYLKTLRPRYSIRGDPNMIMYAPLPLSELIHDTELDVSRHLGVTVKGQLQGL